jgi:hypothetical protein
MKAKLTRMHNPPAETTPLAAAGIVDRASPRAKYAEPEGDMASANPGKAAIGISTGEDRD